MTLSETNRIIIDAVISKAEKLCPGSLALIGVYGSVLTGDVTDRSDLDLLIVINDESGYQLSHGFILEDSHVGYDIYCTTWEMLESDAECPHARISKLMDSEIVYSSGDYALSRLEKFRRRARGILASENRRDCALQCLKEAKLCYAEAMLTENTGRILTETADVISYLSDAVMLNSGKYFRYGIKRTFEELSAVPCPDNFTDGILTIVNTTNIRVIKETAARLIRTTESFLKAKEEKFPISSDNTAGTYEEMYSNWRNKVFEAAVNKDAFSSFMALASFESMYRDIENDTDIPHQYIMLNYHPDKLMLNAEIYDLALAIYSEALKKSGVKINRYKNADDFSKEYNG